jgi:hypothetical protein
MLIAVLGLIAPSSADAKRDISPAPPQILVRPNTPTESYGDWTAQRAGSDSFIATTTNSAGSVFGTFCSPDGCSAILGSSVSCTPDHSYAALINAPGGAFATTAVCEMVGESYLYFFEMTDGLVNAMAIGGVIGVAFPMESGEFKVARFSLTGAARATARIQQLAVGTGGAPTRRNASDETTL